MEGLWRFKSYTTCIKCPYQAKGKNQYKELKKGLIRRDITRLKTQSTNNYEILELKGEYLWLNEGVVKVKI